MSAKHQPAKQAAYHQQIPTPSLAIYLR